MIKEPGYVYIYLSNENETPVEVFFDDFRVEHVKSPVVQMDDYYPFGLTFNEYQRENSTPNQYQYNGKELQDELDLGWLDYDARFYSPEISRWWQIDPLADLAIRWSPYHYGYDNPVRFLDPNGMFALDYEKGKNGDGESDPDTNWDDDPFIGPRGPCFCDDWRLNDDGTFTLIDPTDDGFHRFFNEDGKLIWQTNWTKDDVGNYIASMDSQTPANDFMSNLYTLLRALGDNDSNGGDIGRMYDRANAVGWDSFDLTRLIVESETAYVKDLGDFAKSFLDVRSLMRGTVPKPITQGVKLVTGQPVSNFGSWLLRFLAKPRPGFDFDWSNPKHQDRLNKR